MYKENNELLAEFIGFDILSNDYYQYEAELTRSLPEFNSDWNWLMKVVEKIWSMQGKNTGAQVTICNSGCLLGYQDKMSGLKFNCHKYTFLGSKGMHTKEHTYNACVEFVKWYNNQNK